MGNAFAMAQGTRPWKLWKAIDGNNGNLSETTLPPKFSELNIFVYFKERWQFNLGIVIPYMHLSDTSKIFAVSDLMFIGFRASNFYGAHAQLNISKTQIAVYDARTAREGMMADANFTLYIYYR